LSYIQTTCKHRKPPSPTLISLSNSSLSSNDSYGWHFQYLTIIGLTLSTLTFTLGSLSDITLSPRLFLLKNMLSITSAPLSVLISTLYWSLWLIDPALVVPPELELPLLPDLSFHAFPSILLVVDLLFLSPPWTVTVLPATGISGVIAFAYWFWIEVCYASNGFYPYPLFELLSTPQRIGLFSLSAGLMVGSTVCLKWLYGRVNGVKVWEGAQMRERPGMVKGEE
jgi:FAR-17a/AIG1-like protein